MNTSTRVLMVSLLSVAVLAGCSSNKTKSASVAEVAPPADTTTPAYTGTAGAYGPEDLEKDACLRQRVIQFDFDQYTVKPEYQAVINCHAKYLRDRPSSRQTLEGHTDERGGRDRPTAGRRLWSRSLQTSLRRICRLSAATGICLVVRHRTDTPPQIPHARYRWPRARARR